MLPVPMSVILCFTAQTFITFNALILELTMPFFPVILHYIQFFILNYYFFSFHLYIIQTNFFRIKILLFTSNYVVSLNIKFLHFQISSATNINFDLHLRFNFKLNSNFKFKLQLHTSPLSFNFNFSSTSHVNVKLNLRTTISICTFTPQLQILTSKPSLRLSLAQFSPSLFVTISSFLASDLNFFALILFTYFHFSF